MASSLSFLCTVGVANTDDCGCGAVVLDFDLDAGIDANGLGVATEIGQICGRANREGVALDTVYHVDNAIRSHGTRRDAGVGDDVHVWVTGPGRLQDGGRVAAIRVCSRVHIDGGTDGGETTAIS